MKQCKSCKKEIDDAANKCPFCQGFQTWYRNPQVFSFLFIIPILGFSFWNIKSLDSKNYLDYKDKISFELISSRVSDKNTEFTYKIRNNTKFKWDSIKYQMSGFDGSEKIMTTKNGSIYDWVIQPNTENLITVGVPIEENELIKSWKFEIVDLRTSRF